MEIADSITQKSERIVAIMQPYFFPYAGYFRLLACADIFVILDSVQFNRRGRVHRSEVPAPAGGSEWLTLPLKRQPRDTLIRDLVFKNEARVMFDERLRRHQWISQAQGPAANHVRSYLHAPLTSVIDFLEKGLSMVADLLNLKTKFLRASDLEIPSTLRGQDRIIEIVKALNGTKYVNSPGGRHLYQPKKFEKASLSLSFLSPYEGGFPFLLPALMTHSSQIIRADVIRTTCLHTIV